MFQWFHWTIQKFLENLHREFQHAGSDIVEAFTYNGHREKMRVIGKEDLLEPLNRAALKIAKKLLIHQRIKTKFDGRKYFQFKYLEDKDKANH